MRKLITLILIILLVAPTAFAGTVDDLVGLGMPAEQAEYIATRIPGGVNLSNNAFFKSANAAGSGTLSLIKGDATDDTVINADTGDVIKFSVANTPIAAIGNLDATGFDKMAVDGASVLTGAVSIGGALGVSGATSLDGDATFAANKGPVLAAAVVITPVSTATAPANGITARLSANLATPIATAQYISLPSTPVAGASYEIANRSPYPLVIIPGGASTLVNGTTFSCTANTLCTCRAIGAAELACN